MIDLTWDAQSQIETAQLNDDKLVIFLLDYW